MKKGDRVRCLGDSLGNVDFGQEGTILAKALLGCYWVEFDEPTRYPRQYFVNGKWVGKKGHVATLKRDELLCIDPPPAPKAPKVPKVRKTRSTTVATATEDNLTQSAALPSLPPDYKPMPSPQHVIADVVPLGPRIRVQKDMRGNFRVLHRVEDSEEWKESPWAVESTAIRIRIARGWRYIVSGYYTGNGYKQLSAQELADLIAGLY